MEKNIHQAWLGNKRVPNQVEVWSKEIREKNPDFKYFFWTDENIPEMPEKLKEVYESLKHPAMKSDLLRVYVLHKFGGIYLDADYSFVGNFNQLNCFKDNRDYIVYQKKPKIEDLYNSVMIFNKNSKFTEHALSKVNQPGMWLGPHWYAECVYTYLNLPKHCSYLDIESKCDELNLGYVEWEFIDKNIAKHEFFASWYPGSEWKEKLESGNYD